MRIGRWIKYFVLLAVAIAILCPVVLYILASGSPAHYELVQLTQVQQKEAARQFLMRIQEFGNLAQTNAEFTWSISQEECNDALASLEQIADKLQEGKAGEVRKAMERSGVSDMVVAFDDGLLTIMLKSRDYDKIVSVDIRFVFDQQKQLLVQFAGARVGRLPLPEDFTRQYLERFQRGLEHRQSQPASAADGASKPTTAVGIGGISANDLAGVVSGVIGAIDGQPLPADRTWQVNHKRFRIAGIKLENGKLTLQVQPVVSAKNPAQQARKLHR